MINELDFVLQDKLSLKVSPEIMQNAKDFLQSHFDKFARKSTKKSSQNFKKDFAHIQKMQNPQSAHEAQIAQGEQKPFVIFVNPFSNAATHTLPINAFLDMIVKILDLPQNIFVLVVTFPSVHSEFIAQISSHHILQSHLQKSKLIIYQNDNSLENLIAFTKLSNLLISPSTGTIHLASNQGIKTIGLYSRKDTAKWATHDKIYTIIPRKKSHLTHAQCEKLIASTISKINLML